MKRPFIKVRYKGEEDYPDEFLDESLEDDGVDLDEWGFWRGYYEDN